MTITAHTPGTGRFAQFATRASIVDNVRLSPGVALLTATLEGSDLSFEPGDKVKLAVPGGRPRSYTPARVRGDRLDIVVQLHGHGPTASWMATASAGDVFWSTGALPSLRIPPGRIWFQGDTTGLGLAIALHEDPRYELTGVIQLTPQDARCLEALGLPLALAGSDQPAPAEVDGSVLVGEAGLVARGFPALQAAGVERIFTKPYWSERGTAHRKWVSMTTPGAR